MPPRTTEAEFDALLRRAGLTLPPDEKAAIQAVFGAVEAMQDRIRTPVPAAEAEPAVVFRPDRG
jgi:hypothetical protein